MSTPWDGKLSANPPRDDEQPFRLRPPRKPRGVSQRNPTTYTYFSNGLPKTVKDAAGNVTSFDYDGNGNLLHQTDALGNVTTFTYDNNNNTLSQAVKRTKADGTKETLTTSYFYDQLNRLVKTVNPDKSFTQVSYNSIAKQATTTNANGNMTTYDYDKNGRLSTVTYADTTKDSFTYDNNGNRLSSTSHGQLFIAYQYDPLNRLVLTQYTDTGTVATAYDALGRVQSTTDQRFNPTTYAYDDAGRRIQVTQPCSTAAPSCVPPVTKYGYDEAGNQTLFVDANQNPTTYVYDDAGRRIQTIYADKTFEKIDYDALGRQISRTDQAGKLTQYGYDALGRLTSVTQSPDGGVTQLVTSYAYDELGNRISQTDANGNTTKFAYDQLGRRIVRTLPAGQSESYGYDATGNMAARTDFNGHTTTYSYDKMNRLTQKTADAFFSQGTCAGGACGATQVSYTYTPTGKRATMTDGLGQWQYSYDVHDRLTDKRNNTIAGLSAHWDYDKAGNLVDMQTAHTAQTTYSYDALNRLAGVNNVFEGEPVTYSYDAVGNLSGMTVGPLSTNYSYDTLNRLTSMQTCSTAAPGSVLASYSYTLGPAGNRLSVTELSGRTVQYAYDDLYRLTSETITNATTQNGTISYQYDAVGNRLKLTSSVAAIPSGLLNYDANDRLSTDQYDANGNTVGNGGIGNVYDFENRLVLRGDAQHGSISIIYDGDGNRVQETVAGNITRYLMADVNPTGYSQVVEEQAGNGVTTKFYMWGQQLLLATEFTSGFPTQIYGYDGHGSVRFLTDLNGKITDAYDAFGNLINSTGSTPNNYFYAGEQFLPLAIFGSKARTFSISALLH